jgi:hypothetical protein
LANIDLHYFVLLVAPEKVSLPLGSCKTPPDLVVNSLSEPGVVESSNTPSSSGEPGPVVDACNCLFGSVHFSLQFPFESHVALHVWHIVSASIFPGTFTLQQHVSPLPVNLSPVHLPASYFGSRIAAHASGIIGEPETSGTSKMSNTAEDTKNINSLCKGCFHI